MHKLKSFFIKTKLSREAQRKCKKCKTERCTSIATHKDMSLNKHMDVLLRFHSQSSNPELFSVIIFNLPILQEDPKLMTFYETSN